MTKKNQSLIPPPHERRLVIGLLFQFSDDYYEHSIWKSIVKQAGLYDVNLICVTTGSIEDEPEDPGDARRPEIVDVIDPGLFDGFIIISSVYLNSMSVESLTQYLGKYFQKPCVTIGAPIASLPDVSIDNESGMREIMEHLIGEHAYTRIGFMRGSSSNPDFATRYKTYCDVLQYYGITYEPGRVLDSGVQNSYFYGQTDPYEQFLDDNPDLEAIVCSSDYMAVNITRKLKERSIAVPGVIAVTGFDDSEAGQNFFPPLTTVRQPLYEMGEKAFASLLRMIAGEQVPVRTLLPTRAVIRHSCGCFPYSSKTIALHENRDDISHNGNTVLSDRFIAVIQAVFDQEMAHKVSPELRGKWARALALSILEDLEHSRNDSFLRELSNIVSAGFSCGIDASRWNGVLSEMFEQLRAEKEGLSGSDAGEWYAESLKSARFMIDDAEAEHKDCSDIQRGIADINYLYSFISSSGSIEELTGKIMEHYPRYGFMSCYMSLYTDQSREKAVLVAAFDKKLDYRLQRPSTEYLSRDLFPDNVCIFDRRKSYLITSLHTAEGSYGFMMLEINFVQGDIYEIIPFEVSRSIHSIRLIEKIRSHNEQLQRTVDEKTRELKDANDQLKKLDVLKNDFIANISHDFRSPLTVILNLADLAYRFDDSISEGIREKFGAIYKSSLRLKNTIDKLLELARMDARGIRLNVEKLDLLQYLNTLADYYTSSVINSNIRIIRNLPQTPIENFYTDADKLEEILDNIMSNAVKFVDHDRGEITISAEQSDESVVIRIADNGIGIDPGKLALIFKRFEQAHDSGILMRGTGIGLAFAAQLSELLRATLTVDSDGEGKGSCFTLILKKGKDHFSPGDFALEQQSRKRRSDTRTIIQSEIDEKKNCAVLQTILPSLNAEGELNYKKGVILIIEDDTNIRGIILEYLRRNGFVNFILAGNGRQGLDAVYEYTPDVILCDYNMPLMRGDEIHNRLSGNPVHCNIPFIFLSAVADETLILERREIGAAAYLKKPIEEKLLVITVEEQLRKRYEFKRVSRQATIDELTGINNRRSIIDHLQRLLCARTYRELSLMLVDVDKFKNINDTYGHQAGDAVLEMMGQTFRETLRKSDIAGRCGGDEFVVILPDTSLGNAHLAAQTLVRVISERSVVYENKQISVNMSCGIASLRDNASYIAKELEIGDIAELYEINNYRNADWKMIEHKKERIARVLMKMADAMLYESKKSRRIESFPPKN